MSSSTAGELLDRAYRVMRSYSEARELVRKCSDDDRPALRAAVDVAVYHFGRMSDVLAEIEEFHAPAVTSPDAKEVGRG